MQSQKSYSRKKTKADKTVQVNDLFATYLTNFLDDPAAQDLRCHVSSGKSCGCIQKYIILGSLWKQNYSSSNSSITFNRDGNIVSWSDENSLNKEQVTRARELLGILHGASALKKEKCYDTNDGKDGSTINQIRGMIGLGNGRKRSKKYEEFVLDNRGKLRDEYSLCEKAAQKILGYSINFLYKKLRTNPERTSRLVATTKSDKTAKVGRQLISIEELQNKSTTGQDPCCGRNCISALVTGHLQRIVEWRQRLKGCSQRVAQEIVAEVLRQADSLDGPNSYCQNVVHWVTGCSFKKIRRVREHLKKDPQSLPEHGLKKYWKNKEGSLPSGVQPNIFAKVEGDEGVVTMPGVGATLPADMMDAAASASRNHNNSSNKFNFGQKEQNLQTSSKLHPNQTLAVAPPNQTLPLTEYINNFPTIQPDASAANSSAYHQAIAVSNQSSYATEMPPNITLVAQPKSIGNFSDTTLNPSLTGTAPVAFPSSHVPAYPSNLQTFEGNAVLHNDGNEVGSDNYIPPSQPLSYVQESSQYCELQPLQPDTYTSFMASNNDPILNNDNQPSYYIASNPEQFQHEALQHSGLTPLFLAQAPDADSNQGNANVPRQSYFLFSPNPVAENASGKDAESWAQLVPWTPLQMLPSSYLQAGMPNSNLASNAQQFVLPSGEVASNVEPIGLNPPSQAAGAESNPNYLPTNLTPVAIMQPKVNMIPGWFSTQPIPQTHYVTNQPDKSTLPEASASFNSNSNATNQLQAGILSKDMPQNVGAVQLPDAQQQQLFQLQTLNNQPISFTQQLDPSSTMFSLQSGIPQAVERSSLVAAQNTASDATELKEGITETSKPQGAAISDRSQRFSRDRLGANIESPCIVSILAAPAAPAVTQTDENSKQESQENVQKEQKDGASDGVGGQVFEFPPAHVSRRLAALRMQGQTMNLATEKDAKEDSDPTTTSLDVASNKVTTSSSPSKSLKGSLGSISEDFLQNPDSMIEDLSEITSLPILNLPSAGWSNDNITVKPNTAAAQATTSAAALVPGQQDTASLMISTTDTKTTTLTSVAGSRDMKSKSLLPAPGRKKRKVDGASGFRGGPQKQIRFHIFTPSDFANGQVNVSQFRKPSVYASSVSEPDYSSTGKRSRKIPKKSNPPIPIDADAAKAESNVDKADQSENVAANAIESEADFEMATSTIKTNHVSASSIAKFQPEEAALPSNDFPIPTPPLVTPAVMKTLPSNIKVMLPSADSSNPVPMQLNTPVFLHSGALMTPSGKLNSAAFFCRVSPGQSLSSDKTSTSSTPQFFNFMPNTGYPLFLTPADPLEPKQKLSKSSDSSEDSQADKSASTPLKRSHMTLNLSSKTSSSDDTLQTPSKILVVTPSAMLNSTKLTPDGPPSFSFQEMLERAALDEANNAPSSGKVSKETSLQMSTTVDPSSKSDLEKSHVPSIVVDSPSKEVSSKRSDDANTKHDVASADERNAKDDESSGTESIMRSPSAGRRRSEGEGRLVIAIDEAPKVGQDAKPATPLDTPTIKVVTPTMSRLPGSQPSPGAGHYPGYKMRPQSLLVSSTGTASSTQMPTPIFHLISPGQRPSPSVMILPFSQKTSTPFPSSSLLSPAFGYIQRPTLSGGGNNTLLKSALTKKLPIFQFPPALRTPNLEQAPERREEGATSGQKSTPSVEATASSAAESCETDPTLSS